MTNLERYMRRQEQIAKIDRFLERHAKWGWLMATLLAAFVFAVAMLVKEALDLLGGGK